MGSGWRNQYYRYKEYFLNISKVYYQRPDVRMFLETILTLSITIIFIVFAIKPTIATVIALINEVKTKQELLSQLKIKVKNIEIARNLYNSQVQKVKLIESAVPDQPKPDSLIRQLQNIAQANGVEISGLSVSEINLVGTKQKTQKKSDLKQLSQNSSDVSFSLNASGNYGSLMNFIKNIENLQRITVIDTIAFSVYEKDSVSLLRLMITGRSVFYKI